MRDDVVGRDGMRGVDEDVFSEKSFHFSRWDWEFGSKERKRVTWTLSKELRRKYRVV